jgi:hypothetical protein
VVLEKTNGWMEQNREPKNRPTKIYSMKYREIYTQWQYNGENSAGTG